MSYNFGRCANVYMRKYPCANVSCANIQAQMSFEQMSMRLCPRAENFTLKKSHFPGWDRVFREGIYLSGWD